jgi:hypothetical protein
MAERVRDSGRWTRLGSEFGVSEFKRYEKYGGEIDNG